MADPQSRPPWTALAIVVAGTFIAGAVYFGLRDRPVQTVAPQQRQTIAPTVDAPRPDSPDTAKAAAIKQVSDWLEANRPLFVEKCWKPSAALSKEPPTARYVFSLAFNPAGIEVGRGISEDRKALRPDVGRCLRGLIEPRARITPPGANVNVEVPFTLP
jgi:hypothetical protein